MSQAVYGAIGIGAFIGIALLAAQRDYAFAKIPNILVIVLYVLATFVQLFRAFFDATGLLYCTNESPLNIVLWTVGILIVFSLVELIYRRTKGESILGFGDIKYVGAWVLLAGPAVGLCGFGIGCLLGAIVSGIRKKKTFALAPWVFGCSVALYALCSYLMAAA